jgi:uncharacterized membrane-anchored protein
VSPTLVRAILLLGTAIVLGAVNYSIVGKERIIRTGKTIYLELAPVDPRSLMQGDYMALRFRVADAIEDLRAAETLDIRSRRAALAIDPRGVATLDGSGQSPAHIEFRIRNGRAWLGTNAYFFAEGTGERYARARFGEFRLDRESGDAVLVGLRDENLAAL